MKVKVKLLSVFGAHAREDADGLTTVRDRGTVRALAETLGLPLDQVRIITVNGRQVFLDEGGDFAGGCGIVTAIHQDQGSRQKRLQPPRPGNVA